MEHRESASDVIENIIKDFLSKKLCPTCIEEICNNSLQNVLKLKITDSQKKINYYLAFLKENLTNLEMQSNCKSHCEDFSRSKSLEDELLCDCHNSDIDDENDSSLDEKNMLTLEEYKKIQKIFQLNAGVKKKRKKKNNNNNK
jgi:hypothetical protein